MDEQELKDYGDKHQAMLAKVLEANPTIPPITAHIIAGDLMSAERATEALTQGMPPDRAVWLVGSYARWDWALACVAEGVLSEQWFQDHICELWSGSDPDDTSLEYLRVWRKAWADGGRAVIRDGRPLPNPPKMDGYLRVFRGGPPGTALATGFAWTTDPKIARKFANGAGVRVKMAGGVVISGLVKPSQVMAYITDRNESEVIVDPRLVSHIKTVGEPK